MERKQSIIHYGAIQQHLMFGSKILAMCTSGDIEKILFLAYGMIFSTYYLLKNLKKWLLYFKRSGLEEIILNMYLTLSHGVSLGRKERVIVKTSKEYRR